MRGHIRYLSQSTKEKIVININNPLIKSNSFKQRIIFWLTHQYSLAPSACRVGTRKRANSFLSIWGRWVWALFAALAFGQAA
jgi:hypothetical protein